MTIVQGCWLAGIASMVLPLPMRMGSLDAFIESTRMRIRHGDAELVLIDVADAPCSAMRSRAVSRIRSR